MFRSFWLVGSTVVKGLKQSVEGINCHNETVLNTVSLIDTQQSFGGNGEHVEYN